MPRVSHTEYELLFPDEEEDTMFFDSKDEAVRTARRYRDEGISVELIARTKTWSHEAAVGALAPIDDKERPVKFNRYQNPILGNSLNPENWDGKGITLLRRQYRVIAVDGKFDLYDLATGKKAKTMTQVELDMAWKKGQIRDLFKRDGGKARFGRLSPFIRNEIAHAMEMANSDGDHAIAAACKAVLENPTEENLKASPIVLKELKYKLEIAQDEGNRPAIRAIKKAMNSMPRIKFARGSERIWVERGEHPEALQLAVQMFKFFRAGGPGHRAQQKKVIALTPQIKQLIQKAHSLPNYKWPSGVSLHEQAEDLWHQVTSRTTAFDGWSRTGAKAKFGTRTDPVIRQGLDAVANQIHDQPELAKKNLKKVAELMGWHESTDSDWKEFLALARKLGFSDSQIAGFSRTGGKARMSAENERALLKVLSDLNKRVSAANANLRENWKAGSFTMASQDAMSLSGLYREMSGAFIKAGARLTTSRTGAKEKFGDAKKLNDLLVAAVDAMKRGDRSSLYELMGQARREIDEKTPEGLRYDYQYLKGIMHMSRTGAKVGFAKLSEHMTHIVSMCDKVLAVLYREAPDKSLSSVWAKAAQDVHEIKATAHQIARQSWAYSRTGAKARFSNQHHAAIDALTKKIAQHLESVRKFSYSGYARAAANEALQVRKMAEDLADLTRSAHLVDVQRDERGTHSRMGAKTRFAMSPKDFFEKFIMKYGQEINRWLREVGYNDLLLHESSTPQDAMKAMNALKEGFDDVGMNTPRKVVEAMEFLKSRHSRNSAKSRFEKSDDYAKVLMRPVTVGNCGEMMRVAAQAKQHAKSVGDDDLLELAEVVANDCTKLKSRSARKAAR
jgi:hypothetical protein